MAHEFWERMEFSQGIDLQDSILDRLVEMTPGGLSIRKATPDEDRSGIDYWIDRENGVPIGVDVKNRDRHYSGDVCVEICSVYKGRTGPARAFDEWYDPDLCQSIGWTLDTSKKTDILVNTWRTSEPGRRKYWIVYFPHFQEVSLRNWKTWASQHGVRPARNPGYVTLNTFPEISDVEELIRQLTQGTA